MRFEPGKQIKHGQGDSWVTLDGRAGDTLELQGFGELYYEWQAEDKQALDLEVRATLFSTTTTPNKTPVVRTRFEFGHGTAVIQHPPVRIPAASVDPYQSAILPGRGLVVRLSARQFRLYLQGGFNYDGSATPSSKVIVSVQPSIASQRFPLPYTQWALGDTLQPFPANANEFRVRRPNGMPWFAGACNLFMLSVYDEILSGEDVKAAGYGDWTPIPPLAASCELDFNSIIEYR